MVVKLNLENTLDTILNLSNINKKNIFTLVFITEQTLFDGIDNKIIDENIQKISKCFDLNGDGTLDFKDLEYLKNLDLSSIIKIVNATRYFIEIIETLQEINFTAQQKINLVYRIIIYSVLLSLTNNVDNFKSWLNDNNNRQSLIDVLELINTTLTGSSQIINLFNKINFKKIFCCFTRENQTTKVLNLQTRINTEMKDIHNNYLVNRRLENIESNILKITETNN
jgi:hypothetical protein